MNSEELWTLEDDPTPDMSNPTRSSAERPLDTVRRMSYTITDQSLYAGLPTEIIWPTAPAEEEYLYEPPPKTRSLTNVASIKRRTTLRKSKSKGAAIDTHPPISGGGYAPKRAASRDALSSAHSSSTSLSIPHNKSQASLSSRPPSMAGVGAYQYDLLGALAPRDGGYAIAAQIGHSFSPVSSVNSLDDRRSIHASPPGSFRGARVPSSRSSGMRWSVDGEDPILPPAPVRGSGGSMLSMSSTQSDDYESPQSAQLAVAQATRPCEPSPLSMQTTTAADMDTVASPVATESPQMPAPIPAPAPINFNMDTPVETPEPAAATTLKKAKTKKEMKAEKKEAEKQAKLAAKAEAQRAAQHKAEAAQKAADDKRRAHEEAVRAKAQAKADAARKQKEGKELAKLQKKEAEQKKVEQAKAAEQRKLEEQKRAAEQKKEQKLKKAPGAQKVAEPTLAATPQGRASMKFKRSSSGTGPDATASTPVATPAARGSPPPAASQASRMAPAAAAAGGAAVAAAAQASNPSKSQLYTGPRPPSARTPSLNTQASATPRSEKRGFMSSLKKRFSMASMEPAPTLQKPRPNSIAVSQGSTAPSAPVASTPAQRPAEVAAPMAATQETPVIQPPPRGTSAMPAPAQRPTMPPPVIIPPRGSSANAAAPVAIPLRASSLAIVGGSESSDDNVESGTSNPSSVIVTPTISMDRNSTSSLLEHPRPNGAFRERSDSGISAGGSHTTDGGLHTPPSEASFPAPLQHRKESDSMHMQPPPALTVV